MPGARRAATKPCATQTPPVRSGRRVVFLTVDDSTGPVDATFFEDVQGPYAATIFHSWLLLVRGTIRRAGPRGVSVLASGAWELSTLWEAWQRGGITAVLSESAVGEWGWRVPFLLGAVFGKVIELSGFSKSIVASTIEVVGAQRAMLAIVLMDHFLRQRAQNADVTTTIPRW